LCPTAMQALAGADALAIVTEWQEFRSPDFQAIISALRQPVIFDGRNLYDPSQMAELGVAYHAIGRGLSSPDARATMAKTVWRESSAA
ncbi:MAG: hypothetical protein HKM03_10820, partial [Steroidobacteraceae bacterium]|nr:hypothetical protein [Steroidobacteraceae bacterium]